MSNEQLTDAQISERACKALGIEPDGVWRNDADVREVTATMYPSVLDGAGFLRVVERLEGIGVHFTLSNYPSGHMVELWPAADIAYGSADTLPRALALAVVAWEASR